MTCRILVLETTKNKLLLTLKNSLIKVRALLMYIYIERESISDDVNVV